MRVLYVWDSEYPWDVRTEKICRTLVQHGHEVVITARNRRDEPRSEARPEGVVHRLPTFARLVRNPLSFPAFFNPFWLALLRRITVSHRIEVIIVRDLPLAPAALWAARSRRPVILDMAENYPAMISDVWNDRQAKLLDFLVRNPKLVALVERATVRRVAHIFTVVEESRLRVLQLGVSEERVSVLSNTPSLDRIRPLTPRLAGEPLRIVYLGLMERHRGVATLLEAARRLSRSGLQFRLDLVGDGRDYEQFCDYSRELGLDGNQVVFHGRLPHEKAVGLVESAHVGVVPHLATASWNTTIPNKLFDYMAAGLAVVSSDARPAARITTETQAGVVFKSGDERDLADQLSHVAALETWDRYRRAGQAAIRSRYNWEADSRQLLTTISGVITVRPG